MSLPILPFYISFKDFTDQLHLYFSNLPIYDPKQSWKDYVKSIYLRNNFAILLPEPLPKVAGLEEWQVWCLLVSDRLGL